MSTLRPAFRSPHTWLALTVLSVGCNALFGIEDPEHREEGGAGGTGGLDAGGSSGSAGESGSHGDAGASGASEAGSGGESGAPSTEPMCGNSRRESPEQCDDGNTRSGDGCNSNCQVEDGYGCDNSQVPSTCEDIDECQAPTSPCPPSYACMNTEGSFTCTCSEGTETCGNACVDKQTDAKNCGACGTVCAERCSLGKCQLTLVTNQPNVTAFGIDASNAYWANLDADHYGNAMSVGLNGGTPKTLCSEKMMQPSLAFAITTTDIYWGYYHSGEYGIGRCGMTGGASEFIAFDSGYINSLVVGPSDLYWTISNTREIRWASQMPTSSGKRLTTTTLLPNRLALDAANVYWTESEGTTGSVVKSSNLVSSNTTLATNQPGAYGIAIDTTTVYWTNRTSSGSVMKVSRNGGDTTTLASAQDMPTGIAIDATYAYWANSGAGTIMKVALSGSGTPVTIGTGFTNPTEIAIDATNVYVLSGNTINTITKITPK